jgi:uncharacterized protein (DUF1697 family)
MSEHVVIGLLRAVNVGGRKLTSAQLRGVATGLGYREVATYVNSGNVVLVAPHGAPRVADLLSAALTAEAGFDVPVVTRTAEQWDGVVAALPFADEARDDPSHLVVVAWDGTPAAGAASIDLSRYGNERLEWRGTELYAYYPDGIGRSKLTLPVLEKAAGRVGTARNWNTVLALAKLAQERRDQG